MKVEVMSNGYEAAEVQGTIETFNKAAAVLFPDCVVRHFYYGDRLDMVSVIAAPHGHYGHFDISKDRVSFTGHECSGDEYMKFASLTLNDELYEGRLLEIAAD